MHEAHQLAIARGEPSLAMVERLSYAVPYGGVFEPRLESIATVAR
jgi:hypothetical protein